jgi:hypothetical protein
MKNMVGLCRAINWRPELRLSTDAAWLDTVPAWKANLLEGQYGDFAFAIPFRRERV